MSTRDRLQAQRWADFRRRADYAPQNVYTHRTHGWDYIPVHPFADEPELLMRLQLRPEDCLHIFQLRSGDPPRRLPQIK